jgi:hypothetical protein
MLVLIRGSTHSAFLRAGPRAPRPGRGRSGSRPLVEARPHGTPRHVASPQPDPPALSAVSRRPLKKSHWPIFFSPVCHSSCPSMPERRTRFPHRPGIHLAGFPLPEPLLHAGLRPSVAVVRPLSASPLRAAPFLNQPPPPHPTGLPRAAGPLHTHR